VYSLTVSTPGRVLRVRTPVIASQALRDWFAEETTGYRVVCRDANGTLVSRAQLRAVVRDVGQMQPSPV
jgi:hypothetical protein